MRPLLENPVDPLNNATFFECLDGVMVNSRTLAESMTGVSKHAKQMERQEFCVSVRAFADAVCTLSEHAAQVQYPLKKHFISVVDIRYECPVLMNWTNLIPSSGFLSDNK